MENRRRLRAGEVLFRTGDAGFVAYLIESGAVEIYRDTDAAPIARLGVNELFGEMALAGDRTRTANARAATDTELLVITHDMLAEQMARTTPMIRHLLRMTLARSREALRLQQARPALDEPEALARDPGGVDRELAVQYLRAEEELRRALREQALELHYQPIVALDSGRVAGFEALIRMRDRDGRLVMPSAFIAIAEDSELIVSIGHWIIDTAAAALVAMRGASISGPPPFCSINVSPRQFGDPDLFRHIGDALTRHAIEPQRLRLEITESAAFGNPDAGQLLARCRALGCPLLVDDFGTGYGTLSYLHRLPIDAIKLDRSFVSGVLDHSGAAAIVRAMTQLAADLGMYTVAEGIETAEQAQACARLGVHYGQGYHYARGLALDEALAMLRRAS